MVADLGYDLMRRSRPAFVLPRDWTGVGGARWGGVPGAVDVWAEARERLLETEIYRWVGSEVLVAAAEVPMRPEGQRET